MKDWIGDTNSVFKCLGATSHCESEREKDDFYATDPESLELFLRAIERDGISLHKKIWECACIDCNTEYFNGYEWKKISEYEENEDVLIYDCETKKGYMSHPQKYHKYKTDENLYLYENKYLSMALSKEHEIIYEHRRNNKICRDTTYNIYNKFIKDSNGFRGKILTTFNMYGDLCLDEWQLRLAVACNADGRYIKTLTHTKYEFRVKKQRKKERIKLILEKCKINYTTIKAREGYVDYCFESPLGCKEFPIEWLNLNKECKHIFIDEIKYWDGNISDNCIQYSTSKIKDVNFVQMMAHSIEIETSIYVDSRKDRINNNYKLTFKTKNKHSLSKCDGKFYEIKPQDGYKYCFTVETHALILRRNNKIFITGNCGAGHLSNLLLNKGYDVTSTDLIDRGYGKSNVDFLKSVSLDGKIDILTNPPYKYAQEFVEHAIDILKDGYYCIMFLKIQFLEGQSRRQLFDKCPPKYVYVNSARQMCYINGNMEEKKSSATCYCWFIWEKGFSGDTIVRWI